MLPIDMYTGHADLSPRNWDKQVLSDDRIIGAIVAPFGKAFCSQGQSISLMLPFVLPESRTTSLPSTFRQLLYVGLHSLHMLWQVSRPYLP